MDNAQPVSDVVHITDVKLVKEKMIEDVKKKIFMDSSREKLVSTLAYDIARLVAGKLKGLNRYNLLVLGRKSIGKTTLLKEMEKSCNGILSEHVAVVVIDMNCHLDRMSRGLYFFLANKIGCPTSDSGWNSDGYLDNRLELLMSYLESSQKRLVVFIDELQDVYTDKYSRETSQLVLRELQHILGLTEGLFYIVATGSSRYLRQLAFCKIDIKTAQDQGMKHYNRAMDLNSTKMRPIWMRPIVAPNDFLQFLEQYEVPVDPVHMYIISAGLPGIMKDPGQMVRDDKYFTGGKDEIDSPELKALVSMVGHDWSRNDYHQQSDENSEDDKFTKAAAVYALSGSLRFIPLSLVKERMSENGTVVDWDTGRWYDLADRGIIQMRDEVSEEVALGSYLLYHELQTECSVSPSEAAHLAAVTPDAENIVLRLLASRAKMWLGVELDHRIQSMPTEQQGEGFCLGGYMYKDLTIEGKDAYGTDGVVFQQEHDRVKVHCVQLKLGKRQVDVKKVFQRWKSTEDQKKEDYCKRFRLDMAKTDYIYYLITTCGIVEEQLQEFCAKHRMDVKIFNRRTLRELKVWPADVRSLHPMFT